MFPYVALPHTYAPPGHVIALAGQRPVTAAYPYYLGTSANVLDPGDRAGADYAVLARTSGIWPVDLVTLQRRPASDLAGRLLPRLLAALRQASLSPAQLPVFGYGRSAGASSPWMAESQSGAVAPYLGGQGDQGWRVIIRLRAGHGGIDAKGIYSGGQSENPASPWHGNLTARWRSGRYLQQPPAGTAAVGRIRWELLP